MSVKKQTDESNDNRYQIIGANEYKISEIETALLSIKMTFDSFHIPYEANYAAKEVKVKVYNERAPSTNDLQQ
jgi:hypothetical protein